MFSASGALEKASLPVWSAEERRDLLHFVVCGGGPTGRLSLQEVQRFARLQTLTSHVSNSDKICLPFLARHATPSGCEFAGELSDFVAKDLAPRYGDELVSQIEVTLLQSGKSLLTQFESSLQSMALSNFAGRVSVVFGARVIEVTDSEIVLQNGDRVSYGVLIWAAGNGTRPITGKIMEKLSGEPADEAVAKRRKIPVDEWLRVSGVSGVFALGDCAKIEDGALPSTAQVAGQQGAYLGRTFWSSEEWIVSA